MARTSDLMEQAMASRALDQRINDFTSLSAAQRALSRSIHPSELAPLHEQSRALLIELRDVVASSKSRGAAGGDVSATVIEHFDAALAEQSERTREFVDRIDMKQLRATVPLIAHQHPNEVAGLVDLLLGGDLRSDKQLRILEYLITLLSADEHSGRRRLEREPSRLTERLATLSAKQAAEADADWVLAERMLEEATAKVLQGGDVGEIRDRVRRCKEEFGACLLHPKVLRASVAYNIAMWNHVAAEIDSSRSIDELASDLLEDLDEMPMPIPGSGGTSMLDSREFGSLVAALSTRVRGEPAGTGRFDRCIDKLDVGSISPDRVEDFVDEAPGDDAWLVRASVLTGLVLKGLPESGHAVELVGLDVEELATSAFDELTARMTELSRKHFSAGEDTAAFRLSDAKTHELTAHRRVRDRLMSADARAGDEKPRGRERAAGDSASWWQRIAGAMPSGPVAIGVFAMIPLIFLFMAPSIIEDTSIDARDLATVSPFLVSGQQQDEAGTSHLVARVADTWKYLGTEERRAVAMEIAAALAERGTDQVTLFDSAGLMVLRLSGGDIVMLVPHPADAGDRG